MIKKSIGVIFFLLFLFMLLFSKDNKNVSSNTSLQKPQSLSDIWLDVNRLSGVFRNNGIWYFDVVANTQGTEWPAGSGNSPIFAAGQWIAAKVNGEVRVAGIQHSSTEFQPGEILSPGIAANPEDENYRCYELRSDGTGDWNKWPTEQGAPVDQNGDPLLIGDQTIFSVWNDLTAHAEFGSNPLGVEIRQLAFANGDVGVLGDMHFIKWQIVNKSDSNWDSTYFAIWMDPDLGDAGDDLVGCDTMLGMGFCYNANNNDQTYGLAPPAVGVDLFQGPVIDQQGSIVSLPNGKILYDKKMLKMTAFMYYDGNDSHRGNPATASEAWNFIRCFWQNGYPVTYGERGDNPVGSGHPRTYYMFPGDPETEQGIGWIDYAEDDRRFLVITGPFQMPVWVDENGNRQPDFGEPGVQEIVAAVIIAKGNSNLNSVTELKRINKLAQLAYDKNFNYKEAPHQPFVQSSELSNQIILTWDETSEYIDDGTLYDSEDIFVSKVFGDTIYVNNQPVIIDDSTYNFFGYKVYQYSDVSGTDPELVGSWDIGENKNAKPYTKQRYVKIDKNKNPVVGEIDSKLVNGKTYCFGVVAEGYLEFGNPKFIASKPAIVSVIPRITPGTTYSSQFGDTLEVIHTITDTLATPSNGSVIVIVVDPSKTTGLEYTVGFKTDNTWYLVNSDGDTLANNQTNQSGDDAYNVIDGLLIKVVGHIAGIDFTKRYGGWDYQGNRWVSGTDWGGGAFFGGLDIGANFFGSDIGARKYTDIEMRWAGASDRSDSSAAGLAAASQSEMPERWSKAVVYRRDLGYAVQSTLGDIPFAVFDTWAVPERRLKISFVEDDNLAAANLLWDMGWAGSNFPDILGAREYIFILNDDYDTDYTDYLNGTLDGTYNNVMYQIWPKNSGSHPYLLEEFDMQIFAAKPNTTADNFTFTAPPAVVTTSSSLKKDMQKIKVVPNPYYGLHSGELSQLDRWVQFTFLPPKCTIRIFTMSGHLVRKLDKDDPSTPFLRWDLLNEYDIPVASGIYIYHVEAPEIGEKIGKMIIFMSTYRPDTWRSYNNLR